MSDVTVGVRRTVIYRNKKSDKKQQEISPPIAAAEPKPVPSPAKRLSSDDDPLFAWPDQAATPAAAAAPTATPAPGASQAAAALPASALVMGPEAMINAGLAMDSKSKYAAIAKMPDMVRSARVGALSDDILKAIRPFIDWFRSPVKTPDITMDSKFISAAIASMPKVACSGPVDVLSDDILKAFRPDISVETLPAALGSSLHSAQLLSRVGFHIGGTSTLHSVDPFQLECWRPVLREHRQGSYKFLQSVDTLGDLGNMLEPKFTHGPWPTLGELLADPRVRNFNIRTIWFKGVCRFEIDLINAWGDLYLIHLHVSLEPHFGASTPAHCSPISIAHQ